MHDRYPEASLLRCFLPLAQPWLRGRQRRRQRQRLQTLPRSGTRSMLRRLRESLKPPQPSTRPCKSSMVPVSRLALKICRLMRVSK